MNNAFNAKLTFLSPILTYPFQGITKVGVKREDHAIIYTGYQPPEEFQGEEKPTLRPIQVIPKTPRDKLVPQAHINYGKIYTVEHNVKVHVIGHVAPSSQPRFLADFDATWHKKRATYPPEGHNLLAMSGKDINMSKGEIAMSGGDNSVILD